MASCGFCFCGGQVHAGDFATRRRDAIHAGDVLGATHLSCTFLQCVHTSSVRDSLTTHTVVMVTLTASCAVIGSNVLGVSIHVFALPWVGCSLCSSFL